MPTPLAAQRRVPTCGELRKFLDAASDDCLSELFVLAVVLGLRRGELLGLQWSDISFGDRTRWCGEPSKGPGANCGWLNPRHDAPGGGFVYLGLLLRHYNGSAFGKSRNEPPRAALGRRKARLTMDT